MQITLKAPLKIILIVSIVLTFSIFLSFVAVYDGLGVLARYVLFLTALAACVVEYLSCREFFPRGVLEKQGVKRLGKVLICAVLGGLILELGTEFGAAISTLGCFSFTRFVLFSCISYVLVFFSIKFRWITRMRTWTASKLGSLTIKKILLFILVLICLAVLSAFVVTLLSAANFFSMHRVRAFYFCFAFGGSLALVIFALFKQEVKVESVFLGVSLLFGICLVLSEPIMAVVSWDDETHYSRALSLSYGLLTEASEADLQIMRISPDAILFLNATDMAESDLNAYTEAINSLHAGGLESVTVDYCPDNSSVLDMWGISYIPAAMGLWVGRLLHLPFSVTFGLGRLGNLLFYCIVGFFAIRTIPVKKVFLCVALLVPTLVFLASNYSYDYWVVGLIALFVALFAKAVRSDDRSLAFKDCVPMLLALFFALCPKAIYFPLFALLLLLPKSRFKTKRDCRLFCATAIVLVLLLVASFAIPFVFSGGGGSGDARGGSAVNSSAQTALVLSNPVWYAGVLANFLTRTYLSLFNAGGFLVNFAYFGQLSTSSQIPGLLYAIALLGLAVFTRPIFCSIKRQTCSLVLSLFIGVATAALMASAFYILFTSVGSETIAGCQFRYLLPLVVCLGVTMFGLNVKLGKRAQRALTGVCLMGAVLILSACVLRLVVM